MLPTSLRRCRWTPAGKPVLELTEVGVPRALITDRYITNQENAIKRIKRQWARSKNIINQLFHVVSFVSHGG